MEPGLGNRARKRKPASRVRARVKAADQRAHALLFVHEI